MMCPIGRKAAVDQYRVYNIELIDLEADLRFALPFNRVPCMYILDPLYIAAMENFYCVTVKLSNYSLQPQVRYPCFLQSSFI